MSTDMSAQSWLVFLLVVAGAAGAASWMYCLRYGRARAEELGLSPEQTSTGPLDDSGTNSFDREIFREIIQGRFRSTEPATIGLGKVARLLTACSVLLATASCAGLVALQKGIGP